MRLFHESPSTKTSIWKRIYCRIVASWRVRKKSVKYVSDIYFVCEYFFRCKFERGISWNIENQNQSSPGAEKGNNNGRRWLSVENGWHDREIFRNENATGKSESPSSVVRHDDATRKGRRGPTRRFSKYCII